MFKLLSMIFLIGSFSLYAQDEDVKAENNKDLRSADVLFRIDNKDKNESIALEKNNMDDYNLIYMKSKDTLRLKVNRQDGQKLDADFTALFIDLQLEQLEMKNCSSSWDVALRKEKLDWCIKDEKKTQTLKHYWDTAKARF